MSEVPECSQSQNRLCLGGGAAAQLLTCLCYAKYLKSPIIHVPLHANHVWGGGFFLFLRIPALYCITYMLVSPSFPNLSLIKCRYIQGLPLASTFSSVHLLPTAIVILHFHCYILNAYKRT